MNGPKNENPPSTLKYLNTGAWLYSTKPALNALILILSGVQTLGPVILLLNILCLKTCCSQVWVLLCWYLEVTATSNFCRVGWRGGGVEGVEEWRGGLSLNSFVVLPFLHGETLSILTFSIFPEGINEFPFLEPCHKTWLINPSGRGSSSLPKTDVECTKTHFKQLWIIWVFYGTVPSLKYLCVINM